MHYGGAWHVSLTKGFRCTNLRKFYVPFDQTLWKTDQGHHRATTQRVANVQGGCQQAASRQLDRRQLQPVLPQPGPRHSGAHRRVLRVQSVSFDVRITTYPVHDYDRRRPWMRVTRDRLLFRHRIRQTELILSPIPSCQHRCLILHS